MKNLHFNKGKLSFWAILVTILFTLFSIFMLLQGILVGLFTLIVPAIILGIREGVYIDVQNKKYKSYLSVFGITPAQWKPIPEGTRIGVRILKLSARRGMGPVGPVGINSYDLTTSTTTFELFLYTPHPQRIVLITDDNVEKLYFEAQNLASLLGGEVFLDQRIPEEMYNGNN